MLVGGMMTQIGGEVGLHVGAGDDAQQRIPGAAAHRDPRHHSIRVAGGPHPQDVRGSAALTRATKARNGSGCVSVPMRPSPVSPGGGTRAKMSNAGSS